MENSIIASFLKAKRKELKMTVLTVQEKLSEYGISVSGKTIYGWESGRRQPDAEIFVALCNIYGVSSFSEIGDTTSQYLQVDGGTVDAVRLTEEELQLVENFRHETPADQWLLGLLAFALRKDQPRRGDPIEILYEKVKSQDPDVPLFTTSASPGTSVGTDGT